jgi:hypothetical protein
LARQQPVLEVQRAPLAMLQIAPRWPVLVERRLRGQALAISRHLAKEESIREILLRRQATNLRQTRKEVTHPQLQMALGR